MVSFHYHSFISIQACFSIFYLFPLRTKFIAALLPCYPRPDFFTAKCRQYDGMREALPHTTTTAACCSLGMWSLSSFVLQWFQDFVVTKNIDWSRVRNSDSFVGTGPSQRRARLLLCLYVDKLSRLEKIGGFIIITRKWTKMGSPLCCMKAMGNVSSCLSAKIPVSGWFCCLLLKSVSTRKVVYQRVVHILKTMWTVLYEWADTSHMWSSRWVMGSLSLPIALCIRYH